MSRPKLVPTSTRERILHHGLKLLSKSGLGGVTLGQLAEHTGMSKSGLFAHFGSKEEVQINLLVHTAQVSQEFVVLPAMKAPEGRPRLEALVRNWLGWTARVGLPGGCPVAAAMFEMDDAEGEVREHVLAMEKEWRQLLGQLVRQAIQRGHFRPDLDVEQFVWELCGIYLSHHASLRFVRDAQADRRAHTAVRTLVKRASTAARRKPKLGSLNLIRERKR